MPTPCPPPSVDYYLTHYPTMKYRQGKGGSLFQLTRHCCFSTDIAVKRCPLWRGHHCSCFVLLSLLGPIFYIVHVLLPLHDPFSFQNCLFQIVERAQACTSAFKRNGPLEFKYECYKVLLQKLLCQEFLIMHFFLSTQRSPSQSFQSCWTLQLYKKILRQNIISQMLSGEEKKGLLKDRKGAWIQINDESILWKNPWRLPLLVCCYSKQSSPASDLPLIMVTLLVLDSEDNTMENIL